MASHTLKWLKEDQFEAAWMKELESCKNLNVYEEVDDVGQKAISSRWVYTEQRRCPSVKGPRKLVMSHVDSKKLLKEFLHIYPYAIKSL